MWKTILLLELGKSYNITVSCKNVVQTSVFFSGFENSNLKSREHPKKSSFRKFQLKKKKKMGKKLFYDVEIKILIKVH